MFGAALDYRLLRGLAHSRNRATEAELDARYRAAGADHAGAARKLGKLLRRFEGRIPLHANLRYLDLGCGTGELTLAFQAASGAQVTGVDALRRNIDRAQSLAGEAASKTTFLCADLRRWTPPRPFDVLLSFDTFEHVDDPRACLRRMAEFVVPGGVAALAFGPLFHSPFGDHMGEFFRLPLPWRGLLFAEEALLRVRRECYRPTDPARRYGEIAGGLNGMRYSEFLGHVAATGWRFDFLAVNAFSGRRRLLGRLSAALQRLPRLQDYLAHNVYAVLRRAV